MTRCFWHCFSATLILMGGACCGAAGAQPDIGNLKVVKQPTSPVTSKGGPMEQEEAAVKIQTLYRGHYERRVSEPSCNFHESV